MGSTLHASALVLAAGLSRRMGTNKLLVEVQGQPMVRHVVQAALASHCDDVTVVLGHESEKVKSALDGLPINFLYNPDYREGIGSSVRVGALAVPDDHAVVVCLGDMPFVKAETINGLLDAYEGNSDAAGYVPRLDERRGNPVLWTPQALPLLRTLQGDEGAKVLFKRLKMQFVELKHSGILLDFDTPDDLCGVDQSS